MKKPIVTLRHLQSSIFSLLHKNLLLVVLVVFGMGASFHLGAFTVKQIGVTDKKDVPQVKAAAIAVSPFTETLPPVNKQSISQFQEISIGQTYYFPIPTVTPTPLNVGENTNNPNVKQIDSHTWTVKVAQDTTMASAREIFQALNVYRQAKGRITLQWSDVLASFAQKRADSFTAANTLDGHAGFLQFVNQQDGFHKLGFGSLGENSSIGYQLSGTHLIESVYAADSQHDNNQLDSQWTDVGVGVNGTATDLVFGGKKL